MIVSLEEFKTVPGRLMGVDFGDVRTGLAVSDVTRFLASGIGYISPGGLEKTAQAVANEGKTRGVVGFVVGCPVNMDGSFGPRAARVKEFAENLSALSGLPCAMMDERMTTMAASRFLNETGTHGKKRKGVIDTLSAQIILQNALDRLKNMGGN